MPSQPLEMEDALNRLILHKVSFGIVTPIASLGESQAAWSRIHFWYAGGPLESITIVLPTEKGVGFSKTRFVLF